MSNYGLKLAALTAVNFIEAATDRAAA